MEIQLVSYVQHGGLYKMIQSRVFYLIMITYKSCGKRPLSEGYLVCKFNILFGLKLCLHFEDQFEQNPVKDSLSAADTRDVTKLTMTTLKKMRADEEDEGLMKMRG